MTIDELARASGMTVRNIRAHQSRGLLGAPRLQGRTGLYGDEHLARLEAIKELQAQGLNLEAIRRLLDGRDPAELVAFTRKVEAPFEDEEPEPIAVEELFARWGESASPALLRRAYALGVVREADGEGIELRSPRLDRAGRELVALGISAETGIEVMERAKPQLMAIAESFAELFLDEVWRPFEAAGAPAERWPEVTEALERLRPLAAESVTALFGLLMTDVVRDRLGRELGRTQTGM